MKRPPNSALEGVCLMVRPPRKGAPACLRDGRTMLQGRDGVIGAWSRGFGSDAMPSPRSEHQRVDDPHDPALDFGKGQRVEGTCHAGHDRLVGEIAPAIGGM